jgi:hypothetical protein
LRILPAVKSWFERYALNQLMVIGVITPELEFQKNKDWVERQVRHLGINFPLVIDADHKIWKGYNNDGWPALYLINHKGEIIFDRLGEGGYQVFETEMRTALAELKIPLPSPETIPEPPKKDCGHATADVPVGTRSSRRPISLENERSPKNTVVVRSREGEVALRGPWEMELEGIHTAGDNANKKILLRVIYEATQAFALLSPPRTGKASRFFIKLDDQWLYEGIAGKDVRFDQDGRSFIPVDDLRLYDVVKGSAGKTHELTVIPEKKDSGIYGFSFADACTTTELP